MILPQRCSWPVGSWTLLISPPSSPLKTHPVLLIPTLSSLIMVPPPPSLIREMASIIPKPPVDIDSSYSQDSLLPSFLWLNSKITYEHDDQYHKGVLDKRNGIYRFIFKSHANKHKEEWGVDLPNLPTTWVDLCVQGILVPGHDSHSFL